MVAPDTQLQFEMFLTQNNIDYELIIENVERFLVARNFPVKTKALTESFFFTAIEFSSVNAKKKRKMKFDCVIWNLSASHVSAISITFGHFRKSTDFSPI